MNYNDCLKFIHSLDRFGSVLGLERIQRLLQLLGNPQNGLKFIHIAGTNGKGSITMYCASALKSAGYRVGAYISPYVVDFRERIQINGCYIEKDELCDVIERIKPFYDELYASGMKITEFELITAAAFVYFKDKNCDIVCLEVGMGGRFDATNVISSPIVSVITSISLDHTNILGDTLAKIAFEKCGIIKNGCPVVSYPLQEDEALAVIMERCAVCGCRLILPSFNSVEIIQSDLFNTRFKYDGLNFDLKLLGTHQIKNAITAAEALKSVRLAGFNISDSNIEKGISETVFPARMEVLSKNPLIFIDGAHNTSGVEALKESIQRLPEKPVIVMGMLADKDHKSSVDIIAPLAEEFVAVNVNNPRALDCKALAREASAHTKALPFEDLNEAIAYAVSRSKNRAIVICGSLYLACDARPAVKKILIERQKPDAQRNI